MHSGGLLLLNSLLMSMSPYTLRTSPGLTSGLTPSPLDLDLRRQLATPFATQPRWPLEFALEHKTPCQTLRK